MAVRTKRLWNNTSVSNTTVTLYTCPSGKTALVKLISAVNRSGATRSYRLGINGTADGDLFYVNGIADQSTQQNQGNFIVLQPGDTIKAIADAASVKITGFGAELAGVAP